MSKTTIFIKYIKSISRFINSLLETNLNKLNYKNFNYLLKNNKIILTFVALLVVFISYVLLPALYNQSDVSKKLKNELQRKFNINIGLNQNIKYNIFPKPHFLINETKIFNEQREFSKVSKLKIFISIKNLFTLKKIKITDLIFENANFNLNKKNYNFFHKLLNKSFKEGNLTIKDSNIFYKNFEDEVLFINKILKMKYYYNSTELKNFFYSDNEIFNIPFSMETFFNDDKSKIFTQINVDFIKLKIENILNLEKKKKLGQIKFGLKKFKGSVDYEIDKNHFKFHIFDKINQPTVTYKGELNFKPFYASLESEIDEIDLTYFVNPNAIIVQLLKTEIFNNKNIEFILNMNANHIYKNKNFKNLNLKSKIEEGYLDIDQTNFEWKNFVNFQLQQSLIYVRNNELVLDGKLMIKINNHNEVYKFLQTPKNYRNQIKEINLNFKYNFDQKIVELSGITIDNKINQNINKILNNIILKKNNLQNKVYFKKLLNEAIKSYAG